MDVLMPQLGETVASGKITTWHKAVGDRVAAGDVLFEVDSDKAAMEVPSIVAGVLQEIRVQAGESASIGTVVAIVAEAGAAQAAPQTASKPAAVASTGAPQKAVQTAAPKSGYGPAKLADGRRASPLARRLAHEANVDLANVKGSGPRGRINAADVRGAHGTSGQPIQAAKSRNVKAAYANSEFKEIPLDGMRRTIAARLTESKQTVPHFYVVTDLNVDRLVALRADLNARLEEKLSLNDFIVKAYAAALSRLPAANAVWNDESILQFKHVDIGVAVAVDGGLFTPVVRRAEEKTLRTLSAEIKSLAERAKTRKLAPEDYAGGAATISNLGMYGVREFSAIINPPQASILAVGGLERRPVEAKDGSVRFVNQMTVTLSADHRVIDGAVAAELMKIFKGLMEEPVSMLI